jgi:hypothetical protein
MTTAEPLFRIDMDGQWYHDGAPIRRHALAQLFATRGLRREADGRYWLQSPESRYPVEVADVPFIIVDYDIENPGPEQRITLITNMDERVVLGDATGLTLRTTQRGEIDIPYITIRPGLDARINRAVYYQLIERADHNNRCLTIRSHGIDHVIGKITEEGAGP